MSFLITLVVLFDAVNAVSVPMPSFTECKAWGDPHYTTFDGSIYHFQGEGYFDYVKDCDSSDDMIYPLVISGKHETCGNDVTCLKEVLVQFKHYDENDGTLRNKFISFEDGGNKVTFKNAKINAIGTHSYVGPSGSMTVYVDKNSFKMEFEINGVSAYIKFDYSGTTLIVEIPFIPVDICGLCGNFNGGKNDDFTKCNNGEMIEFIESNTNIFGESCCRKDLDIKYIGESDCNPLVPPSKPPTEIPTECSYYAEIMCKEAYYQYCSSCENSEPDEEFLSGCVIDICSVSECENILGIMDGDIVEILSDNGCFDTSINFCNVDCPNTGIIETCNYNTWKHLAGEPVNVYGYWNNNVKDHRLSLSSNGGSGWKSNGIVGRIWTNEVEGVLVPFYEYTRQANGLVDHYYTTNAPPLTNWRYHGIIGYVMKEECEGFNKPLYMYYASKLMDHYYTMTWQQSPYALYWNYQLIAGYILEKESEILF